MLVVRARDLSKIATSVDIFSSSFAGRLPLSTILLNIHFFNFPMQHLCQHCATPYKLSEGIGEFCCAGCEQVYLLIKEGGMSDYYRLQDRASQPIKDRTLAEVDLVALAEAQRKLEDESHEAVKAVFEVQGMSCLACAWLVERLAANQPALVEAKASLIRHTVSLQWKRERFDLGKLGSELFKFGYRLGSTPKDPNNEPRLSPLALRCLLSLIFTVNALLLAVFSEFVIQSEDYATLLHLLSSVCVCFTLLLGAAPFLLSAYRSAKIRRLHSDWLPVLWIVASIGYLALTASVSYMLSNFLISTLVCVLIFARWLGTLFMPIHRSA